MTFYFTDYYIYIIQFVWKYELLLKLEQVLSMMYYIDLFIFDTYL